ncbi:hypothetical protein [Planctomicrobium piriforme]|uniref:hypothetical protein n=1 Tax=Planctomicrobium piriforme TaxID=1576369 RepID=UPI001113B038|nr:hypothetical protein [Planctomicrobium piriforme]
MMLAQRFERRAFPPFAIVAKLEAYGIFGPNRRKIDFFGTSALGAATSSLRNWSSPLFPVALMKTTIATNTMDIKMTFEEVKIIAWAMERLWQEHVSHDLLERDEAHLACGLRRVFNRLTEVGGAEIVR